jgi:hypothetical protein
MPDWPPLGRQLPPEVRIIDWTRLAKGGYIKIQPSMFSMRGIVSAEVVATRETALAAGNLANVGSFTRMNCQMTFESLLSFKRALAAWMTTFELPLRDGGWHTTETRGEGIRHAVLDTGTW